MTKAHNYSDNARLFIKIAGFVITLILNVDAAWLPFSTITLYENIRHDALKVRAILAGTWLTAILIEIRLQNDVQKAAVWLKNAAFATRTLVLALSLVTALAAAITVFTYLASAAALPLVDPYLAGIDAAIGFDWLAFTAFCPSARSRQSKNLGQFPASAAPRRALRRDCQG